MLLVHCQTRTANVLERAPFHNTSHILHRPAPARPGPHLVPFGTKHGAECSGLPLLHHRSTWSSLLPAPPRSSPPHRTPCRSCRPVRPYRAVSRAMLVQLAVSSALTDWSGAGLMPGGSGQCRASPRCAAPRRAALWSRSGPGLGGPGRAARSLPAWSGL